jgi:hypothetical protein
MQISPANPVVDESSTTIPCILYGDSSPTDAQPKTSRSKLLMMLASTPVNSDSVVAPIEIITFPPPTGESF